MRSKRIELKTLEASEGMQDGIVYKNMLEGHFSKAPAQGLSVGQIRARLRQLGSLKASTKYFDIEHRDHDQLVKELESEKWTIASPNIVTFIDDVRDAPDAPANNVVEFKAPEEVPVG